MSGGNKNPKSATERKETKEKQPSIKRKAATLTAKARFEANKAVNKAKTKAGLKQLKGTVKPKEKYVKPKEKSDPFSNYVEKSRFVGKLNEAMKAWMDMWKLILGNIDKLDLTKPFASIKKQFDKTEKKIKVPKIKDKEKLKTTLAAPQQGTKLVDYLYKSIGLAKPELKSIKPPTTELKLPHLIKQLKQSLKSYVGKKDILEKFTKTPPLLFKGDMVVTKDNLAGKGKKFNAGFVMAINEKHVYIRNHESKGGKPQKIPVDQLEFAFHMPGNKTNGKAPKTPAPEKA